MRFGKQLTITTDGTVTSALEQKYANFAEVKRRSVYTETVKVGSTEQALAEFLKLLDRNKGGSVEDIGIFCVTDKDGAIIRVEKTWVVTDLR